MVTCVRLCGRHLPAEETGDDGADERRGRDGHQQGGRENGGHASALQRVEIVDRDRRAGPEQNHQDGQADRRLGARPSG
jgi:hypothetical protein